MATARPPLWPLARDWGRAVVDFLYPPTCPLCYRALESEDDVLCFRCRAELSQPPEWQCPTCGGLGFGRALELGRRCRLCPPPGAAWQGALAVVPYFGASARCVHLFKYRRRPEMGRVMAGLMVRGLAERLATLGSRIELVAPVPLHWRRLLVRGFNQSETLALPLAAALGHPCVPRLLRRVRWTRRQALVPHEHREANVAGAFQLSGKHALARRVRDRGVLLVDDVLTTGHTIQECARVLREAGAREVWVACFARAGMGRPDPEEHAFTP